MSVYITINNVTVPCSPTAVFKKKKKNINKSPLSVEKVCLLIAYSLQVLLWGT